jgi:hypothetical protein
VKLSQLPGTVRAALAQVRKSGSGSAFTTGLMRPSREEMAQGTRAFATQGTASAGNTPNPLRPGQTVTPTRPPGWDDEILPPTLAYFSTDKVVVEGEPGTIIQNRDWPPNPSQESVSTHSGHREQVQPDGDLHMGEGPGRILRFVPVRIWGVDNAATGQRGTEASYDGNTASHDFLAHLPIARQALGVKGPQKLSDDNAVVPAIYAGNPRA